MLIATAVVRVKGQILTPGSIDTLHLIAKQFVTFDCVGDTNSCTKFGAIPSTGSFCGQDETKIFISLLCTFFRLLAATYP